MGLPFSSLPTVTITRKGFFRLRFFILLICPNPFGSRFLLLFLLLGFRAGAPSCNGYPQCGHDKALSLTCSSHSGHFMSITFSFQLFDLLFVIIYYSVGIVNSYTVRRNMVRNNASTCPTCGGKLKPYDKVLRVVRTKGRKTKRVSIRRLRCTECGGLHREIPQYICPYKQYEKDVIQGVLEGLITCETLGYEDYPSEMTMRRWLASHKLRLLLWRNP